MPIIECPVRPLGRSQYCVRERGASLSSTLTRSGEHRTSQSNPCHVVIVSIIAANRGLLHRFMQLTGCWVVVSRFYPQPRTQTPRLRHRGPGCRCSDRQCIFPVTGTTAYPRSWWSWESNTLLRGAGRIDWTTCLTACSVPVRVSSTHRVSRVLLSFCRRGC